MTSCVLKVTSNAARNNIEQFADGCGISAPGPGRLSNMASFQDMLYEDLVISGQWLFKIVLCLKI